MITVTVIYIYFYSTVICLKTVLFTIPDITVIIYNILNQYIIKIFTVINHCNTVKV